MPTRLAQGTRHASSALTVVTAVAGVAALLAGALTILPGAGAQVRTDPLPERAYRNQLALQASTQAAHRQAAAPAPQGVEGGLQVPMPAVPHADGGQVVPGTVAVATSITPDLGDKIAWPTANHTITSPFGIRQDPFSNAWTMHVGVDFGAACGDAIMAAAPGTVIGAGPAGSYGNRVVVLHADRNGKRFATSYNHLEKIDVAVGTQVKVGQRLGANGTTGKSTGCHLHFEAMIDGQFVDPMPLITGAPSTAQLTIPVGAEMPSGPIVGPSTITPTPMPTTVKPAPAPASGSSVVPTTAARPSAPAVPAPGIVTSTKPPVTSAPPVTSKPPVAAPPSTTPPSTTPPPTTATKPPTTAPTCVPRPPAPPTTAPTGTAKPTAPTKPTAPAPTATNGTPYCPAAN